MRKEGTILIVDDEEDILLTLRLFLKQHFARVVTEHNPHLIPRMLRMHEPDVILLDMNFRKGDASGQDGLMWLGKIMELYPQGNVIMITAYGDVNLAVEATKIGAVDFVEKPWRNEKLLTTINAVYKLSKSKKEVKSLQSKQQVLMEDVGQQHGEIIGNSPKMRAIFNTVNKVAKTDANVLILGENGTGKELIAREIHRKSQRANQVFINVDLGSITESLFESELFGHKKGSFTDAREDRAGRFEVASGGSLFLDEIGNLSLPLQAKLLTAIQSRKIMKVGSSQQMDVDIRLICATNMSLYDMVKEGGFRQDLMYRINTVEIELPPLRERLEDLPVLAEHFLKMYGRKYQREDIKFASNTLRKLEDYSWPGNIRELRHAVERAIILSEGKALRPEDFLLQDRGNSGEEGTEVIQTFNLDELEKWAIQKAMTKHRGNITKAADDLGITRAALYRRLEKYGL